MSTSINKNSINKNFLKRLLAQRDEAKLLGMTKLATQLSEQIAVNPVRDDDSNYTYDFSELKADVVNELWDASIRVQDFYNTVINASDLQEIIEKHAEDFINDIRVKTNKLVGEYESKNPGEDFSDLEVTLDD